MKTLIELADLVFVFFLAITMVILAFKGRDKQK